MKRSLIALFGGLIASGLIGAQFGAHVYSFWKEGGWQGLDRLGCEAIPLVASGETAFIPVVNWTEETPLTKEMVVILHGNTTDKNFGAITVESDEMLFNRLGKQTPDSELDPWEDGLNPVGTERTYYDSVESTEGWYASWPTEVWPGCTNYSDGRDHKPVANRWWIEIPIKADVDGRKLFFSVGITGQELTSKAIYLVADSKELLEAGNFVREFGSNAKFAIKNRGNTSFRAADYVPLRPSDYTRDWWWDGPKYQYNNSRSYIGRVIDANYQANLNAGDNRKGVPYTAFEMSIRTDYNKQNVGSKTAFVAPEAGRLVLALCDDDQFFQLQNDTLKPFASTTVAKASTSDQRRFWFYNAINEGKLYEVDLKAGETAVFSYPYEEEYDENNASLYIGRLAFFPGGDVRSISVTGSWSTLRYQNDQPFPYSPGVVFGGGVYREGEPITLTAISYPGHEFDRWEVVYLGKHSGQMSIPEAITNAINTANESHAPTLTLPEVESIYGSASDEAAIVVRAHWKNVQIAQVRTDPLDVAKYKGGRPTGNGLVIDGHEQTFSAPESVATGSKDGKVYAFTHWEQPVSKAASNILLAASDSPSSEATFSTTVAINATTPITTYVAHYAAGYPIKSAVLPAKSGSIAGPQASAVGSEVTYTASPAQYYRFVHWSNSVTKEILSTEETYTFTMPDAQVSLTATFEKIPVEVKLEVPGGSALGTASGGKETLAGTKLTLKATPAKNTVFAGWYFDEDFNVPAAFPNAIDYRTASISFTPTGERPIETFYARFVSPEEDQFISIHSPRLIYTAGETVDETLSLRSCSLPKVSVKGLPSGMKFDAKTFKLSGAPTKPGFYEVTFEATNASIKKATEDTRLTVTMEVQNFTDQLLPIADSYGDGNTIIPGVAQSIDLGEEAIGWSATELPAGMKWDAKTGTLMGAPNKPGRYTIIFTKKVGKETHTVSTTFTVAPFPQLTIQAVLHGEASDDVPIGTVSGSGEYAANTGVKLMAKPAKGFVFSGWSNEFGEPLPGLTVDYRTASVTWPMADSDTTIYASFVPAEEDQDIFICPPHSIYTAGETVDETLWIGSYSLPKISVKGLPSGMKFDAKTLKLSGAPTKPGFYEVTFEVTNASVKKATEDTRHTVTMEVLNFDELGIGDVATPVEILAGATEHNDSRFAQLSGASVAGLPRGLKWNPQNGTLSGATSTLGNYTVTFTRNKLRTSLTFVVSAQPIMAVAMVTPEANQNLLGSASTSRAPSAGTYSLAGTLIGDWAEAVEGDTLSGTITLEANGNAHATLLLGAEADTFSLTGGVENDGSILLFGVCPADFVKPGALIEVLIDNQEVYFTTGDLNGYGLLTEGPFSLTPVSK